MNNSPPLSLGGKKGGQGEQGNNETTKETNPARKETKVWQCQKLSKGP